MRKSEKARHFPERLAAMAMGELLDVNQSTLATMVVQDIIPRVSPGVYDPKAVIHAYIKHLKRNPTGSRYGKLPAAVTDQKNRLQQLKADQAELTLEERRSKLVRADNAIAFWGNICTLAKTRLMGIPKKLAAQLALVNSPVKIEAMLAGEITLACTDLALGNALPPTDEDDNVFAGGEATLDADSEEGDDQLPAAAEPDGESVGRREPETV